MCSILLFRSTIFPLSLFELRTIQYFYNRDYKMHEIIIAILIYLILLSTKIVSITVYNNAQFIPIDTRYMISTLSSISLDNRCLCACYNITICFIAMYSSTNQTCVLFSAHSSQGQLQILPTIWHSKVYSFNSRNSSSK